MTKGLFTENEIRQMVGDYIDEAVSVNHDSALLRDAMLGVVKYLSKINNPHDKAALQSYKELAKLIKISPDRALDKFHSMKMADQDLVSELPPQLKKAVEAWKRY